MNTTKVIILYLVCLVIGQGAAIGMGLIADRFSPTAGVAVFIPTYYAMYWVAWRVALWIGDRSPEVATETAQPSGHPPMSAVLALLAPAALTLELCD